MIKKKKRDNWFLDVTASSYGDDNPIAVSASWIAVSWNSAAAGPVAILPLGSPSKVKDPPFLQGHSKRVSTLDFDPFDDNRLATGSEDNTVCIWNLPSDGLKQNSSDPAGKLSGHTNKLTTLRWNTSASGVLATGSTDKTVRVWDVNSSSEKYNLSLSGMIFSLDWNYNSSLIVATTSDKKVAVIDPRQNKIVGEAASHEGVKPSFVTWLGKSSRFLTTGFSKSRERQFYIWDSANLTKPVKTSTIDSSTGVIIPLFDQDTNQLYLAGKGDTTVRVFEITDGDFTVGTNVVSKGIQKGVARVPKSALNIMGCEINRVLRATDNEIIPCNFIVPRKTHHEFAADLFPLSASKTPALSADEWFSGSDKDPVLSSLEPGSSGTSISSQIRTDAEQPWASSSSTSSTSAASSTSPASARNNSTTSTSSPSSLRTSSTPAQTEQKVNLGWGGQPEEKKPDEYYALKKMNIVRSSKYRNILLKPFQQSQFYTNLKIKTTGMEGNPLQANAMYFGVPWVGSGGQLAVFPLTATGKVADSIGTIETGSDVMCFQFFPGEDSKLVTGLDNGKIRTWDIPVDLYKQPRNFTQFTSEFQGGHARRLSDLCWHPLSNEVLLSTGMDLVVKLWDLNSLDCKITLSGHTEQIQSVAWNYNGSIFATSCKDMKLRVWDPRGQKQIGEARNHEAPKASRLTWLGNSDKVFSVGFNKQSSREFMIWDIKKLDKPLVTNTIDLGNGIYEPFYDEDMELMQLVAMGDTTIRYYEFEDSSEGLISHYLTDNKLSGPTLGIAKLPKRIYDIKGVEVGQFLKITPVSNTQTIERFSVKVPRTKNEFFQDDIYKDTRDSTTSVISSDEWFSGKNKEGPKTMSLRPEGMKLLSEVPQVVKQIKKFNPDDIKQDAQDLKNAVVNRFYNQMQTHKEEANTVAIDTEGVHEDEWADY